jgi:hypothetical protein
MTNRKELKMNNTVNKERCSYARIGGEAVMSKEAFQTMANMFKAIYEEPAPFYDKVVWNTIKFKWPEGLRRAKKKRQRKKDLKKYNSTRFYGPVILNGGDNGIS